MVVFKWVGCMKYTFKSKLVPLRQEFNIQLDHINEVSNVQLPTETLTSQALLDELPQPIWVKSKQNQYYYNQAICQYLGKNLNQHEIIFWQNFIHPEDFEHFIVLWQQALLTQHDFAKECRIKHVQKGYRFCLISVQHHPKNLNNFAWMVTVNDIHEHYLKQLELAHQVTVKSQMLDASLDGITMLTADGRVSDMNRSACLALGVSINAKKFGMSWLNLLPESMRNSGQNAFNHAIKGENSHFDGMMVIAGQPAQYWEHTLSPVLDDAGLIQSILCVSRDISPQKMAEKKLKQVIELDELTGLYNRRAFNKIFKKTIQNARQQQQSVGFLLIDLDYFKHINDTLGHIAGDYLLQILGQRLSGCFKSGVVVARLGGDEFAIIVPNLTDESELLQIAKTARLQLDIPICYAGQYINGGMSTGCAIYPRDAQNSSTLLQCADVALNDLKISGRGGIRMFKSTMFKAIEVATKQLALARAIIQNDKIVPFYQPKVRLADAKVIGFEALLRWYDKEGCIQLPSHIFSSFQDYELATRISEIMQLKVFQDMTQWLDSGMQLLPISINAAPVEFLRDNYAETLLNRLAQFNIPYEMVEIEITEQSLSERGSDYVIRALKLLKKAGIHISLDDFGTGHSSLTRLRNYPVDCLKIDRNFIENMHDDPSAMAIVKAISQIGASISLNILVEGIEHLEQLDALKACDCHIGQGFYFHRPMAFDHITALLQPVDAPDSES
ncbi:PAS domain S-box-containing protein/diguanylate cyclase (GGDEF) domain-containing protein [Acinetobacter kyonggiensis]|uniref:PAS domain S-box-containing protein/diguanylate cyclase (GGDEF) domain-containing protein n=2 Tax=Acinetobacter kyonggiensis TaxID=595670 RepID=A0A1H3KUR2_9GAMM|nr:PAS domain S-box-containing protein/diguanylate cyclase (GGDEF) domain-containing protein [Acinetobacter kyonggiensis]